MYIIRLIIIYAFVVAVLTGIWKYVLVKPLKEEENKKTQKQGIWKWIEMKETQQ